MTPHLIGAAITFSLGSLIAFLSYLFSAHTIKKKPDFYASTTVIRQVIHILFFVAVYFIGKKTEINIIYLLIGAALGITLPMFYFTSKLVRLNDGINKNNTKEGDNNG